MDIKEKSHALKPIMQIGKSGISESVLLEVSKHLKKRKLIKVKLLSTFLAEQELLGKHKEEIAQQLAKDTNAQLVQVVGNVVTLCTTR